MARVGGMSLKEFRGRNRRNFLTGDAEEISKMVEAINNYILKI